MSMMGPLITQSIAQVNASDRAVTKPGETKKVNDARARRRPEDAYESIASAVDPAQAARRLSSNDQEDAHEDRQEHQGANLRGEQQGDRPALDVKG